MKILLSNKSASFSQTIQDTKVILEWNSKIGIGIYKVANDKLCCCISRQKIWINSTKFLSASLYLPILANV